MSLPEESELTESIVPYTLLDRFRFPEPKTFRLLTTKKDHLSNRKKCDEPYSFQLSLKPNNP